MNESERYLLQERLSEIQTKMLIVWGKHDRVSCSLFSFSFIAILFDSRPHYHIQ